MKNVKLIQSNNDKNSVSSFILNIKDYEIHSNRQLQWRYKHINQ